MSTPTIIPFQRKNYRIGIDVGDRSVGLAFVEFAADAYGVEHPVSILKMVSHRHDGGMDPTTNKTPQSRKATGGVARRVRRLRRRRVRRLKDLDHVLTQHGFPLIDVADGETYECWQARSQCVQAFVGDPKVRAELVSRSVRHMARHRGWKNPWWSFEQLSSAPVPTENHQSILARAQERYANSLHGDATLGEIAAVAAGYNDMLRPRTHKKLKDTSDPLFKEKILQEDQLSELRKIFTVQDVPEAARAAIERSVFQQLRPTVPTENIGRDSLPGMGKHVRAVRASLEFQEFRIRAAIANLRVRTGARSTEPLDVTLVEDICTALLENRFGDDAPTWAQVAEFISLDPAKLVNPTFDDVQLAKAPYNRTTAVIEKKFNNKNKPVKEWWQTASFESKSLFVDLISDTSEVAAQRAEESGLMDVIGNWPEDMLQGFLDLNLESGRAAYSRESLARMSKTMREHGVDLHEARKMAFGVDDEWRPALAHIESQTGQPTVDRVISIVRKTVMAANARWGAPQHVIVEHVRSGFMGPAARAELQREINFNTAKRNRVSEDLQAQGFDVPNASAIRRVVQIQKQNCVCLYCGTTITAKPGGCELDHVVPRSGGGSNRRSNLVAVCRDCNASKGKLPFAAWAESSSNSEVSVAKSLHRLKLWNWDKADKGMRLDLTLRLKRTSEDPEIDERSLASTAYAAREVRERIESYFADKLDEHQDMYTFVRVYEGSVTRDARRASGIDSVVSLRGKSDKDRFDYRHHAIDAAVMTLLDERIVLTLRERNNIRAAERMTGAAETWKTYRGRNERAQAYFDTWRADAQKFADMINVLRNADRIPVVNQLRLSEHQGSLHKDTVRPMLRKRISESWTKAEIKQVIDPQIYLALNSCLLASATPKVGVDTDARRELQTPEGKFLGPDHVVEVVNGSTASIRVKGGSVEIGESIHHARIYGWLDKKGGLKCGMLRVYGAEFPYLKRMAGSNDVMTMAIDPGSFSYRDMQDTTRNAIESGAAKLLGWVTQNDELEIDISTMRDRTDTLGQFLQIYPESHWRVDGFYDSSRFRIRPSLLSREGMADTEEKVVQDALTSGLFINAASLLGNSGTHVLRRNSLGDPLWRGQTWARSWSASKTADQQLR